MIVNEIIYFFASRQAMIFILLLSSCLCVTAENGYGYEVEVQPLNEAPDTAQPFKGVPTGRYTFLDAIKTPQNPGNQPALDKGRTPEMRLGLNTVHSQNPDNQYVMDLVLVLDSSYSITLFGWMKIKNAAKKLIDSLNISPQGTHVAIMKYSTDVETYYMFDPKASKDKLKQLLDNLQFDGEWSRLDIAMQSVDRHVFVPIGGARLGKVPKAVVIFSDGKSDGPTAPEEEIDWQQRLVEPLNSLRNKNVDIFSVAAGVPDKDALEAITGSSARVFDIDSVDNLVAAIKAESLQITPPLPPLPPAAAAAPTTSATTPPTPTTTPLPTPSPQAAETTILSNIITLTTQETCTAIETLTLTTLVASTPVTTVITTETQTTLLTATETASTVVETATQTDTVTETVTATTTEPLTSTAKITATSTVAATATATKMVTLTTMVEVTSTTYAKAVATPIPITLVGSVERKKKKKIPRAKRWYEDYLPKFVHRWMAIKE
ncbi:putative uncharacterized protein DDB_G0290521 [Actinia tenebrosa]|uniref:VWFA domain-containing protein n=1 Tax=Actinia tenebrosa TaxID=6105 RepID=A0A6P8J883_ACTTE|nr:putative uncharacterized protein DDB_G0290521 [Actinia tenebrosa]